MRVQPPPGPRPPHLKHPLHLHQVLQVDLVLRHGAPLGLRHAGGAVAAAGGGWEAAPAAGPRVGVVVLGAAPAANWAVGEGGQGPQEAWGAGRRPGDSETGEWREV